MTPTEMPMFPAPVLLSMLIAVTATAQPLSCPEPARPVGASPPVAFELKCVLADGTLHGPGLSWYASGELMSRHNMRDGREHGLQESWWPNGERMMRGVSVDGHRYQGFEYWNPLGEPVDLEVEVQPTTEMPAVAE